MIRNRRDAATLYRGIGEGCARLFVQSVIAVTAVAKVIVGGEYISACPYNSCLPVYVIVSGCLVVFLSTTRNPALKTLDDKSATRWAVTMVTVGVLINLTSLGIGTWMVIKTWTDIHSISTGCGYYMTGPFITHNSSFVNLTTLPYNGTTVNNITDISKLNLTNSLQEALFNKSLNVIDTKSNETDISISDDLIDKCVLCDVVILNFTLVTVCIDWLLVFLVIVYIVIFCRKKCSQIKEALYP